MYALSTSADSYLCAGEEKQRRQVWTWVDIVVSLYTFSTPPHIWSMALSAVDTPVAAPGERSMKENICKVERCVDETVNKHLL